MPAARGALASLQRSYLFVQNFHGFLCQGVFVSEETGGITERNFSGRFAGGFPERTFAAAVNASRSNQKRLLGFHEARRGVLLMARNLKRLRFRANHGSASLSEGGGGAENQQRK